jgi:hypothetical protein
MIADNTKPDPTQTEVHHSQVSRYPIKDFSGGTLLPDPITDRVEKGVSSKEASCAIGSKT